MTLNTNRESEFWDSDRLCDHQKRELFDNRDLVLLGLLVVLAALLGLLSIADRSVGINQSRGKLTVYCVGYLVPRNDLQFFQSARIDNQSDFDSALKSFEGLSILNQNGIGINLRIVSEYNFQRDVKPLQNNSTFEIRSSVTDNNGNVTLLIEATSELLREGLEDAATFLLLKRMQHGDYFMFSLSDGSDLPEMIERNSCIEEIVQFASSMSGFTFDSKIYSMIKSAAYE